MHVQDILDQYSDRLIHAEINALHKVWSVFQLCGISGLVLGMLLALLLAWQLNLSAWVVAGLTLAVVLSLVILTMITKIITGSEQIINYHQQIAASLTTTGLLHLLQQPALHYL